MADAGFKLPKEEMLRRQRERIAKMTPDFVEKHRGQVIVADLLSDDFEVGNDVLAVGRALQQRCPDGAPLAWRVPDEPLTRFGGFRSVPRGSGP